LHVLAAFGAVVAVVAGQPLEIHVDARLARLPFSCTSMIFALVARLPGSEQGACSDLAAWTAVEDRTR
jgi:hypothetical protein